MTSQVVEDKALSRRLSAGVTTETVKQTLIRRYGRGWQSALADVLGLSSKTVNDWVRKKKLPRPAQIAIGAILHNRSQIQARWSVVQDQDEYLVCDISGRVGRVVARARDLTDAIRLASAPLLEEALDATSFAYETSFEHGVAAQDADEEDADIVDPGLTLLREVELATTSSATEIGDGDMGQLVSNPED